ncbi:hypothetical protein RRF57_007753 [Xylaria bambusicola]|uniref:Uncharacterized protein n=1 Tax=Xylaria bambusicola TaxID=326684 RepID=A0AAN7UVV0_9PEZI
MSLSLSTRLTAPYVAARASFSEAFADRVWAGRADKSYTDRDMESVWSDIRCRRCLGVAPSGVVAFMRSERYVCSCFARVDLPDVGNPVTMMSFSTGQCWFAYNGFGDREIIPA